MSTSASAKNEAIFREVIERLATLNEALSPYSGIIEIICECGDTACVQQLSVAPAEYQYIRGDSTWFAIVTGAFAAAQVAPTGG